MNDSPHSLTDAELAELNDRRTDYIQRTVQRGIRTVFSEHPKLQSATLLVSQYWDDEATDAVHSNVVFSVLNTPDLDAHFDAQVWNEETNEWGTDAVNLEGVDLDIWAYWEELSWDDNNTAIPLFAAFCVPGSQDLSSLENCRPYCVFRRTDDDRLDVEIVGTRYRPWLDGLTTEEIY